MVCLAIFFSQKRIKKFYPLFLVANHRAFLVSISWGIGYSSFFYFLFISLILIYENEIYGLEIFSSKCWRSMFENYHKHPRSQPKEKKQLFSFCLPFHDWMEINLNEEKSDDICWSNFSVLYCALWLEKLNIYQYLFGWKYKNNFPSKFSIFFCCYTALLFDSSWWKNESTAVVLNIFPKKCNLENDKLSWWIWG